MENEVRRVGEVGGAVREPVTYPRIDVGCELLVGEEQKSHFRGPEEKQ
jgi:hypothetical protein